MAAENSRKRIVVAGAGGVFGSLLVAELTSSCEVVALTRATLDLNDIDAVARASAGAFAFACTAGPFQQLDAAIVRAVVGQGTHWLDIADDHDWFFALLDDRNLDALARSRGVVVMPGLSTLPAVSAALVLRMGNPSPVTITLTIGNANRKGAAAIASASRLQTPDRELLRRELGIDATVKTRFEVPGVHALLWVIGMLPPGLRGRAAHLVAALAAPLRLGSSGGSLEARAGDRVARLRAPDQRIAVLPLVFALEHLEGRSGCLAPTALDPEELLGWLERELGAER